MSNFEGKPPFSNSLWVAIETMHFHIDHTIFFRTPSFPIQGVPINNSAPMKNVLGVQGSHNWMPGIMAMKVGVVKLIWSCSELCIGIYMPPNAYE